MVQRSVSRQVLKSPVEAHVKPASEESTHDLGVAEKKKHGVRFSLAAHSACRRERMNYFEHLKSIHIINSHLLKPHQG